MSHSDVIFFWFSLKLSQVLAGYALWLTIVFLCSDMLKGVKRVRALVKIFSFDPGSSIKLLWAKIEKMFSLYPDRPCHHLCRLKTYQLRQLLRVHRTNICWEQQVLVNIGHSSCTPNSDHVGIWIMNGNTQKETMMSQTLSCFLKL